MNDEQIKELSNMTYKVLTLLGMVTPMIMEYREFLHEKNHYKVDWFLDALNAVVYENKPIPPFPRKELL